ncbi:MAG: hypothetical protein WAU86_11395 [Oricola sp.]
MTGSSREQGLFARFAAAIVGVAIASLLWLWALTWRKDATDLEKLDRLLRDGAKLVAVFWHGKYFSLFALAAGRRVSVVTTLSFRGNVIASICRWFGYQPVRIEHGVENHALAIVEDALSGKSPLAAIAVDGPLGPRREPKPGAIRIASDLGYRLLPISVDGTPKTVSTSRSDRHEIPWPFARVRIAVGVPMDVPKNLSPDDMREWQALLRERLEALDPANG